MVLVWVNVLDWRSHWTAQQLMQHPKFDSKNPNKLRVVLGAFMSGNPVRFYAADGSGFEFIAIV